MVLGLIWAMRVKTNFRVSAKRSNEYHCLTKSQMSLSKVVFEFPKVGYIRGLPVSAVTELLKAKPSSYNMASAHVILKQIRQRLGVVVNGEEKWQPTILRMICL